MDTAMTTFARGVSAPKQGVGTFTHIEHPAIDQTAVAETARDVRSAFTADAAERRAIQREQAWIDAAAIAGMRMIPRA